MKLKSILLLYSLISIQSLEIVIAHKITGFQGDNSLLIQEALLHPYPLKSIGGKSIGRLVSSQNHIHKFGRRFLGNDEGINATLSADQKYIKDGGSVKIVAEIEGVAPTSRDYFTISCGHVLNDDDILDAVSPASISSSSANVEIHELTFLRCNYTFSYVYVDANEDHTIIGQIEIPSEDKPTVPKQPHLVYGGDPSNMRVMYVSSSNSPLPMVRYWKFDESSATAKVATGTSDTYSATDLCEESANQVAQNLFRDPGFTHTVHMDKLVPDTEYSYQVGNDQHGWSKVFNFRSAPDHPRATRFVAFGDQDITEAGKNTSYYVLKELNEKRSEFTLHFGDLGYGLGRGWVWDRWGSMVSPGAAIAPYMVSVGNHELDHVRGEDPSGEKPFNPWWWTNGRHASNGECGVPTFVRWGSANPDDGHGGGGKKMWYSFDWGNVHVVMMDSEHDWQNGSKQYSWLEENLANVNRSRTPWVVVTSHRPMYTTERCIIPDYIVSQHLREAMDPLFEKYRVNLALVAHLHSYERTCLIRNGKCVERGGTQHITVGSAGAFLDSCEDSPIFGPYDKVHTLQWGYLRVEASDESMKLAFVLDADGSVYDSYEVLPWE